MTKITRTLRDREMDNYRQIAEEQLAARNMRLAALGEDGCYVTIDLGTRFCRVLARSNWTVGLVDGNAVIVSA